MIQTITICALALYGFVVTCALINAWDSLNKESLDSERALRRAQLRITELETAAVERRGGRMFGQPASRTINEFTAPIRTN